MAITSFNVPTINDAGSVEKVTNAVRPSKGVSDVIVNVPARIVQVVYDSEQTDPHTLKAAIEAAGFLVQRYSDGRR